LINRNLKDMQDVRSRPLTHKRASIRRIGAFLFSQHTELAQVFWGNEKVDRKEKALLSVCNNTPILRIAVDHPFPTSKGDYKKINPH